MTLRQQKVSATEHNIKFQFQRIDNYGRSVFRCTKAVSNGVENDQQTTVVDVENLWQHIFPQSWLLRKHVPRYLFSSRKYYFEVSVKMSFFLFLFFLLIPILHSQMQWFSVTGNEMLLPMFSYVHVYLCLPFFRCFLYLRFSITDGSFEKYRANRNWLWLNTVMSRFEDQNEKNLNIFN
jgi:hypothetical protein